MSGIKESQSSRKPKHNTFYSQSTCFVRNIINAVHQSGDDFVLKPFFSHHHWRPLLKHWGRGPHFNIHWCLGVGYICFEVHTLITDKILACDRKENIYTSPRRDWKWNENRTWGKIMRKIERKTTSLKAHSSLLQITIPKTFFSVVLHILA